MKIFIGADHRGFALKEQLKQWLHENKIQHEDVGAHELDPNDDYTHYAQKIAESVAFGAAAGKDVRGIVICGSGVGVDIVANKFDGIRCGLGINVEQVSSARRDDDINVLALAADATEFGTAREMVNTFITVEFDMADRRLRRLREIKEIEKNNQ